MKKALITIAFASSLHVAYAQGSKYDSLKNLLVSAKDDSTKFATLEAIAFKYLFSFPDSALNYVQHEILLAKKTQSDVQLSRAYQDYGWFYIIVGDYPQALYFIQRSLKLAEKSRNRLEVASAYDLMAAVYEDEEDFQHALRSEKIAQSIVGLYQMPASNDVSVRWEGFAQGLASVYEKLNQFDSALKYAGICDDVYFQENGRRWSPASYALGNIYSKKKSYSTALQHYRTGIALAMGAGNTKDLMDNCNGMANTFRRMGQFDSSLVYANKVLEEGKTARYLIAQRDALKLIADDYRSKNNTDSLAQYLGATIAMQDSLFGQQKLVRLQSMTFNEDLRQQQEGQQRRELQTKIKLYSLLAAVGVFALVGFLLYRNNRHKQKAYTLLQRQKEEIDVQKGKTERTLEELRSTQAQLIQSEKMASLGELTAGIAHEIQNPLNFVNNFSDVNKELLEELKGEADKGNMDGVKTIANDVIGNEEKISHHGKRADAIVKGMLQHSRTGSATKEPTDINRLADEYLRLAYQGFRARDKSFNATFTTEFDNSTDKVNVVPQEIGRVILNLINNAFYAVNERSKQGAPSYEPTVIVRTRRLDGKMEISVKDNGNGIPGPIKEKIFQPFFTTKPTGQGTGLGLSLAYDIVKAHGGQLKVETSAGEGSEFIIIL